MGAAPVQRLWASRPEFLFPRYYSTFPGLLIMPIGRGLPHLGAPGQSGRGYAELLLAGNTLRVRDLVIQWGIRACRITVGSIRGNEPLAEPLATSLSGSRTRNHKERRHKGCHRQQQHDAPHRSISFLVVRYSRLRHWLSASPMWAPTVGGAWV